MFTGSLVLLLAPESEIISNFILQIERLRQVGETPVPRSSIYNVRSLDVMPSPQTRTQVPPSTLGDNRKPGDSCGVVWDGLLQSSLVGEGLAGAQVLLR